MRDSAMPEHRTALPERRAGGLPVHALREDDLAACRASLAANSKTFHAASLLLPPSVRAPATVLYGFCRLADDAVDVDGGQQEAIARLRSRLDSVYAGRPQAEAADRALAAVVSQYAIPRELPEFLIEGLAWDAAGRDYETLEELYAYAARVAGAVGAMMSLLMGVRSPAALARACDLGVAMQLSNIARDVAEDARMGRIYLPKRWLREAGIEPEAWLAAPVYDQALAGVVQRLLDAAHGLYQRVGAGVSQLPLGCRPGINAARFMYAEIGHQVRRQIARHGTDALGRRAVVPNGRKCLLLLRSALALWPPSRGLVDEALAANRPLLDWVAASTAAPPWPVEPLPEIGSVGVVLGLFERLERQDRMARSAA